MTIYEIESQSICIVLTENSRKRLSRTLCREVSHKVHTCTQSQAVLSAILRFLPAVSHFVSLEVFSARVGARGCRTPDGFLPSRGRGWPQRRIRLTTYCRQLCRSNNRVSGNHWGLFFRSYNSDRQQALSFASRWRSGLHLPSLADTENRGAGWEASNSDICVQSLDVEDGDPVSSAASELEERGILLDDRLVQMIEQGLHIEDGRWAVTVDVI